MNGDHLYCPCCERAIRTESNLRYHLLTKHRRSELSASIIDLLRAQQDRRREERALVPR
ncbi:hypothetical protein [Halosolutus halophilus]|uniref:hypothetical protein n=1 Tax=Halosolutus halophilus TaxID=1552990 RepID=UPI0022350C9A|nr:hypothetical protein [Halosolutus halophilus]